MTHKSLSDAFGMAGLEEKVSALPKGVETPLNRQINEEATDLSGGEIQKLLLARAIYRDAKILILMSRLRRSIPSQRMRCIADMMRFQALPHLFLFRTALLHPLLRPNLFS